jgi:hypothetical protein
MEINVTIEITEVLIKEELHTHNLRVITGAF